MRYFRRIEDDEWLRIKRRKQNEKSEATQNKFEYQSSNMTQNTGVTQWEYAELHAQEREPLTAFRSMSRMEQEWISAWYEQFLKHQQLDLWKKFESLTMGQKRAVLLDISQIHQQPIAEESEPKWDAWSKHLSLVAEVPLQDEETFQEKRLDDVEGETSFYMLKQSELLSPYREILWWLCYKGNHQGQQSVLHLIDQLGIDAKKLLLLRLNGAQKCTSRNFSQQLTILQHQQTVVDWERIMNHIHSIEQLDDEQVQHELIERESASESQQPAEGKSSKSSHAMTTYDSDESDTDEVYNYMDEQELDEKDVEELEEDKGHNLGELVSSEAMLSENSHLSSSIETVGSLALITVFLGLLSQKGQAKIKKLDFIDACLRIPLNLSPKQRMKAREKHMKQHSLASLQQLFEYIVTTLSKQLYVHGVQQYDPQYDGALKVLSLLNPGTISTEDRIKQRLLLQIEQ